jgi:hypothetical protein
MIELLLLIVHGLGELLQLKGHLLVNLTLGLLATAQIELIL